MEWILLDPAVVNFVKLLMSLGEIMFFNRVFGKSGYRVDRGPFHGRKALFSNWCRNQTPILTASLAKRLAVTFLSLTAASSSTSGREAEAQSPYEGVDWKKALHVASVSHFHTDYHEKENPTPEKKALDIGYKAGIRHFAISNYYPSEPCNPEESFPDRPKDIIISPNAEHHSFSDAQAHINSLGSGYSSGHRAGIPWQTAFRKMIDQFILEDGGGITINHPRYSGLNHETMCKMLDFDERVLGIEVWNHTTESLNKTGWSMKDWDAILATGRRCFGFFVTDHAHKYEDPFLGRNVLLVSKMTEADCLRAYRQGRFYGALKGSGLRFESLIVKKGTVSVRTNAATTIRFISEKGVLKAVKGKAADAVVPGNASGKADLVYLRVEASDNDGETLFSQPIMFPSGKEASGLTPSGPAAVSIIPQPQTIRIAKGQFRLQRTTTIGADNASEGIASWLAGQIKQSTSYQLSQVSPENAHIRLSIKKGSMGREAYQLTVTPKTVFLTAGGEAGLLYGCHSLLQLFPAEIYSKAPVRNIEWIAPAVEIQDAPRYEWRSFMVDVARHYLPVDLLRDYIDWMAMHKLNRFHLHLTDDPAWRIEIKAYPKLTTIGAKGSYSDKNAPPQFYTQEQLKELVAYARTRHVVIVPEIDMPGHFGAAARAYPELDGGANTLNVTAPQTQAFLDAVFKEVRDIFGTPYIHYGSDEVRHHNWNGRADMKAAMEKLGLANQHELEGWFDRKVAKDLLEKGCVPLAWDEAADFGIDKRAIVQWWRCLQPEKLVAAVKQGYRTVISPPDFSYFDYPYVKGEYGAHWEGMRNGGNSTELVYNWQPIPKSLTEEEAKNIIGFEACLWTEFIRDRKHAEYMTFPRLSAFAEQAWGRKEGQSPEEFQKKLQVQIKRYKVLGINYRIPGLSTEERRQRQPEGFKL